MKSLTKEGQSSLTTKQAIQLLKDGNKRFLNNLKTHRNLLAQVNETSDGQFPLAVILSCIDSRTSAELIFDQGLGDIFSVRVAGNVINEDILGSMEFSCKLSGAKLIVVLGHTGCGAIRGACDNVQLGNLTALLNKIKPAIEYEKGAATYSNSNNREFLERVATRNVRIMMNQIIEKSPIICQMVKEGKLAILGGMYNVVNGIVEFYDADMITERQVHALENNFSSI
jgi:carbonic anhydrase